MNLVIRTLAVVLMGGALASAWGTYSKSNVTAPPLAWQVAPTVTQAASQHVDGQEEMLKLFADIERGLEAIDVLLSDAAAGDTNSLVQVQASGLDDLLRNSVQSGRVVQDDIQRLIDLAQQPPPCPGCGAGT